MRINHYQDTLELSLEKYNKKFGGESIAIRWWVVLSLNLLKISNLIQLPITMLQVNFPLWIVNEGLTILYDEVLTVSIILML